MTSQDAVVEGAERRSHGRARSLRRNLSFIELKAKQLSDVEEVLRGANRLGPFLREVERPGRLATSVSFGYRSGPNKLVTSPSFRPTCSLIKSQSARPRYRHSFSGWSSASGMDHGGDVEQLKATVAETETGSSTIRASAPPRAESQEQAQAEASGAEHQDAGKGCAFSADGPPQVACSGVEHGGAAGPAQCSDGSAEEAGAEAEPEPEPEPSKRGSKFQARASRVVGPSRLQRVSVSGHEDMSVASAARPAGSLLSQMESAAMAALAAIDLERLEQGSGSSPGQGASGGPSSSALCGSPRDDARCNPWAPLPGPMVASLLMQKSRSSSRLDGNS